MNPELSVLYHAEVCDELIDVEPRNEGSLRYINSQYLAEGGMKKVFRVEDSVTGKKLARAELQPEAAADMAAAFMREAKLVATLQHPNIVSVQDLGTDSNGPWFTMELITGTHLAEVISQKTKTRNELLDIFLKICDAVAYAHSQNVIHLDLKPENVQIGDFGEVILCDWGLAKYINREDKEDCQLDLLNNHTLHGYIKGTPGYMAPEQIHKKQPRSCQTDVFSLGAILYALFELEAPFKGEDLEETLKLTCSSNPTFKETPEALQAVILKALHEQSTERYSSVRKMKQDVEHYIAGFATAAENAGFFRQVQLFYKRNILVSNLIVCFLGTLIIGSIYFIDQIRNIELQALEAKVIAESNLELFKKEQLAKSQINRNLSDTLILRNRENVDNYDFDSALKLVNDAVDKDPENLEAWMQKGWTHFVRMEIDDALVCFKKSQHLIPDLYKVCLELKGESPENAYETAKVLRLVHEEKWRAPLVMYAYIYFCKTTSSKIEQGILTCEVLRLRNNIREELNYAFDGHFLDLSHNPGLRELDSTAWREENMPKMEFIKGLKPIVLNLSHTGVENLQSLANTRTLREVHLNDTPVKILAPLLNLPKLRKIYLNKGQISEDHQKHYERKGIKIIYVD